MPAPALTRSLLTIGFVAVVGSGCQLDTWLFASERDKGGPSSTSSGAGGTSGASTGAAGSSGVPGMMCVNIEDGGPSSCKDAETWKRYGTDACKQQNMQLTDVVGGTTCGGGYQNVTYVCCATIPSGSAGTGGSTGPGAAGSSGDSGGGGGMCTTIEEGGPGTCRPYDAWKQHAYDRCQQQSLLLTAITVGPCDGDSQSMTFTCCSSTGTPTPSPPPPKCGETTDASGQICKICWDSVSGNEISNDCVPGSTGSGGSGGGGQMCIAIDDGGPTSCKDAATWKRYGSDRCAQQNLALTDVKVVVACDGGSSVVSYVCCASP